MKIVRLLLIVMIAACNSKSYDSATTLSPRAQYDLLNRFDSLAALNPDSAIYYYDKASEILTDSTYKGTAFQKGAELLQSALDYNGSIESANQAASFFSLNTPDSRNRSAYCYNLMGSNCLELGRYGDAFKYYDLAIQNGDSGRIQFYKVNKGVAYQKTNRYDEAIKLFEEVLNNPIRDTSLLARGLSNLAKTKWLRDPAYNAAGEFHDALLLREMVNDRKGLATSYMHLADYYTQGNPDSARYYAEKMYRFAAELGWHDDRADALKKLATLEDGAVSKKYLRQYLALSDSLEKESRNKRNQYADIRFNVERERANSLALAKSYAESRFRVSRQRLIIYAVIFLFAIIGVSGIIWYKRRKRLQEIQTRNAIRDSELKTSQKVHDVVANGLYRIMNELEHEESIEKEPLLDKIENLYEQSRDISYEHSSDSTGEEAKKIKDLLTSFASDETRVLLVGIGDNTWGKLSLPVKRELEYVLQELMVNMRKHSRAKNVLIRFSADKSRMKIIYQDDGIGIPEGTQFGNGLKSTGNRINVVGGRITFDGSNGLRAEISIPTA